MQNARERFLGIFLEEWKMFMDRATEDGVAADEKRDGNFDVPVKAGELRIFADYDRPLIGLLYKQVDDSWIVVPVSEFSVPATEQEILIGKRVYQLWNSFTADSSFVERSWIVDDVAPDDMKDLSSALLHVMVGDPLLNDLVDCTGMPITSLEDPRLGYEKRFVAKVLSSSTGQVLSQRTLVKMMAEIWKRNNLLENAYRLAAATNDDPLPSVPLIIGMDAFKGECRVASGFKEFRVGGETRVVRFCAEGNLSEELWHEEGIKVVAYKRSDREHPIGTGTLVLEAGRKIIRLKIGNVSPQIPVDNVSEIVLCLVRD